MSSTSHAILMKNATSAVNRVADDKTVAAETVIDSLEELAALIEGAIEGLNDDIRKGEK